MVTTNNIREFIRTTNYLSLLNEVIKRLNIHVSKDEPSSQMFNILATCVNKSNINLDKLNELCHSDKERLVIFVKLKLAEIEDDEDDYNEGDDKYETIEILPFP
ncbi:hypothetical protein HAY27_004898, partial [Salmonella enterica]|nr:hypothetical protein [Salmonella enterica]